MSFNIVSAKLTGSSHSSEWAQVYEFEPQDLRKAKIKGKLYAVISTSIPKDGIDKVLSGREILSRLHEEYFAKKDDGGVLTSLKHAVSKVIGEFSSWEGLEIAAASYLSGAIYLVVGGGAQAAILRDETITNILTSDRNEVVSASGYPEDNDIFLIAPSTFLNSISVGEIKAALSSKDVKVASESLAPKIHSQDGGKLGVIFLKFEKKIKRPASTLNLRKNVEKMKLKRALERPSLVKKLKGAVLKLISELPRKGVYVKAHDERLVPQKRKLSLSVGLILIFLLVVSIGFGVKQKIKNEYKARYQSRFDQATHELNEAYEVYSINPVRARELFIEARSKVLGLKDEGITDTALDELQVSLEENEGEILGVFKQDLELFVDLSLLSSGFVGDLMVSSGERIFILDKQGEKIIKIVVQTKRSEVVAGPDQISEAEGLASYEDRVFILNSKGIFEVGENFDKVIEFDWEGEVIPFAYAGNFYILEKSKSNIWRYTGAGLRFFSKANWLASSVKADLSSVSSWVIDGSIWVLTESGAIFKFNLGNQQTFKVSGVFPELIKPVAIYTNEELEHFYILDVDNSRVVVVTKEGEYKAQYVNEKVREAKNLVVSEKEKKMILLTGEKLVSLKIEHL
jgi:hypothetical protein